MVEKLVGKCVECDGVTGGDPTGTILSFLNNLVTDWRPLAMPHFIGPNGRGGKDKMAELVGYGRLGNAV